MRALSLQTGGGEKGLRRFQGNVALIPRQEAAVAVHAERGRIGQADADIVAKRGALHQHTHLVVAAVDFSKHIQTQIDFGVSL